MRSGGGMTARGGQQDGLWQGDKTTRDLVAERQHGGQQDELWRGDETTHSLVAEWRHGRVSRTDFGEETRRRTSDLVRIALLSILTFPCPSLDSWNSVQIGGYTIKNQVLWRQGSTVSSSNVSVETLVEM